MNRRTQLAKVHIAKQQLGLDEDTYRDYLRRHGAQDGPHGEPPSSKSLSDRQLDGLLDEFKAKGWQPRPPKGKTAGKRGGRKLATGPEVEKIRALWLWMHQLGIVRDPSESALASYARRIAGIDDLHWADGWRCERLIETLKQWAARELPSRIERRLRQMQADGLVDSRNTLAGLIAHAAPTLRPDTFTALHSAWCFLDDLSERHAAVTREGGQADGKAT